MKTILLFLMCLTLCIGCDGGNEIAFRDGDNKYSVCTQSENVHGIRLAISEIAIGASEADLVAAMKPKSLDSGTVYWGGTGARRMYFHIEHDKQIWFELSGPLDGDCVTEIGRVEPKTKWSRKESDSITVD